MKGGRAYRNAPAVFRAEAVPYERAGSLDAVLRRVHHDRSYGHLCCGLLKCCGRAGVAIVITQPAGVALAGSCAAGSTAARSPGQDVMQGKNVASSPGGTEETCLALCTANPACNSAVFFWRHNGCNTCYLKSGSTKVGLQAATSRTSRRPSSTTALPFWAVSAVPSPPLLSRPPSPLLPPLVRPPQASMQPAVGACSCPANSAASNVRQSRLKRTACATC